jgi:hypothetical protein
MTSMPATTSFPAEDPAETVTVPALRWWQRQWFRALAGTSVALAQFAPTFFFAEDARWVVGGGSGWSLEVQPYHLQVWFAFLLIPFLRHVAYRKRDFLLIAIIPFYGEYLAGKVIYRLLGLPRRDWPPRPDELPRAVRIPGGRGAYLLPKTVAEAETQRAAWCINPNHQHPYATWSDTRLAGCAGLRTQNAASEPPQTGTHPPR